MCSQNVSNEQGRVHKKVALVTGGASGIGRATARLLAKEGAFVIVADLSILGLDLVDEICESGGNAEFLQLDVTSETDWADSVAKIASKHARIDILCNVAGILLTGRLTDMSLSDFRRQNAVNVEGVFLAHKHVIPLMEKGGGGSIVNMSSVAALRGVPFMSAYAATKGAIRSLTKSVALEYAHSRIRVNSVHPGQVDTPMLASTIEQFGKIDNRGESVNSFVPMGRTATAEDVAAAVIWLASDESAYVTGSELVIDGGLTV